MVVQALAYLLAGKAPNAYGIASGVAPSPAPTPTATPSATRRQPQEGTYEELHRAVRVLAAAAARLTYAALWPGRRVARRPGIARTTAASRSRCSKDRRWRSAAIAGASPLTSARATDRASPGRRWRSAFGGYDDLAGNGVRKGFVGI